MEFKDYYVGGHRNYLCIGNNTLCVAYIAFLELLHPFADYRRRIKQKIMNIDRSSKKQETRKSKVRGCAFKLKNKRLINIQRFLH